MKTSAKSTHYQSTSSIFARCRLKSNNKSNTTNDFGSKSPLLNTEKILKDRRKKSQTSKDGSKVLCEKRCKTEIVDNDQENKLEQLANEKKEYTSLLQENQQMKSKVVNQCQNLEKIKNSYETELTTLIDFNKKLIKENSRLKLENQTLKQQKEPSSIDKLELKINDLVKENHYLLQLLEKEKNKRNYKEEFEKLQQEMLDLQSKYIKDFRKSIKSSTLNLFSQ